MSEKCIWWGGKRPAPGELTRLGEGTLPERLGIEFTACGDDWIAARMPVDHRTHQPWGRLHGGASVALAETVGSVAAGCCIDSTRFAGVGMEINANHIRPAHQGWVVATARPESLGRTAQVWSIRIEDEQGRLVCLSRMTVAVIARERT